MKKLLIGTILATMLGTANAMPITTTMTHSHHNDSYHVGYNDGKHDAYNNVARTAVIVGAAVIATVIIYQLGRESRWTTNERGVAYRF